MNIIDVQDQLKNFSEQQLISEMQMPSGSAPQFLVLSEIKRRKRVRDDFMKREAANQPTVAEEAIAAAGVPQSGVMGMSEAMAPQAAVAEGGIGSVMPQSMRPQTMPAPTDDAIPMRSGGLAQFGQELSGKVSEGVEPFLDEVEGMAQDRFGVDVSGPLQGGIADLSRPPYEIARPTQDFMGRIPPFMRQPGFSARPAVLPAFPIRRGGKGGPRFSNMMVPTSELGLAQRQDRAFAEGGVVRAANGLPLGLRQNNPGNIRPGAGFYGETGQGGGYAEFGSEDEGLRALARLLGTYSDEYGINTLRGLTSRYAPRSDNEESFDNYISYLGETLGMDPDEEFDLKGRRDDIIPAIVGFEQGRDYGDRYSDDQVARAIRAAGTEDEAEIAEILAGGSEPNLASRALSAVGEAVFPSAEASGPAMRDVGTPQEEFDRIQSDRASQSFADQASRFAQYPLEIFGLPVDDDAPGSPISLFGSDDPEPPTMMGRTFDDVKSAPMAEGSVLPEDDGEAYAGDVDRSGDGYNLMRKNGYSEEEIAAAKKAGVPPEFYEARDALGEDGGVLSQEGSIDSSSFDQSDIPLRDKSGTGPVLSYEDIAEAYRSAEEFGERADYQASLDEERDSDDLGNAPTKPKTEPKNDPDKKDTPKGGGDTAAPTGLAKEIADLQAKLEKDRETDKYLALAQAGLALMSSKDPTLLGAVGEAGVSGLTAYREAQDRYQEGITDLINAKAKLQKKQGSEFTANQMLQRANELRKLISDGMGTEQDNIRNAFLADMLEQRALNMGGGGLGMFDVATQE